jgi:hypothetical protein
MRKSQSSCASRTETAWTARHFAAIRGRGIFHLTSIPNGIQFQRQISMQSLATGTRGGKLCSRADIIASIAAPQKFTVHVRGVSWRNTFFRCSFTVPRAVPTASGGSTFQFFHSSWSERRTLQNWVSRRCIDLPLVEPNACWFQLARNAFANPWGRPHDDHDGEPWPLPQTSHGKAQVAPECIKNGDGIHLVNCFANPGRISQLAMGSGASVSRRHSRLDIAVGLDLQVGLEFGGSLRVLLVAAEES